MHKAFLQNNDIKSSKSRLSHLLLHKLDLHLSEVQLSLDSVLDKRLVRTFYDLIVAILLHRHNSMGLLLSELGGYICGFAHAPAGTKRISNLLRSKKWTSTIIDDFLFSQTRKRLESLVKQGKRPLMLWDDSRLEKAESWFLEGLCSVESSKAKRLTRIKKGYYSPPNKRICVPGYHWTSTLLSALGESVSVCQMSWWTTRGKYKEYGRNIIFRMLEKLQKQVGKGILHVLDRGYANEWTIEWFSHFEQDFLVRWKKNHLLIHSTKGKKQTHLLARSFKAKSKKIALDSHRKILKSISIAWTQVQHPSFEDINLSLVIVRDTKNYQSPLYLLTSLPVESAKEAWEICHSYMHRWNVEQAFRFAKTELAIESPRLWFFENTLKLLAIVTLIYDFLMKLIRNWPSISKIIINQYAHRTGNRCQNALTPIYRLRTAIHHLLWFYFAQNSG